MRHFGRVLRLAIAGSATMLWCASALAQSILGYHGSPARTGIFIVPHLTYERARGLHLDPSFDGHIEGHVYAQPLFWHFPGSSRKLLIVATEENVVYALDAHDGKVAWQKSLGRPVARAALPCGNISTLGITGTPVIDGVEEAVYLDAMVDGEGGTGPQHMVFGLSIQDGTVLPGFPVNVGATLKAHGMSFDAKVQNQRGALVIVEQQLFVPYGGHFGDCGQYHGWVVGMDLHDTGAVAAWSTRAAGGGVWAPGGIAYDGRSLFVATGNTKGAQGWSDGEAVIRLGTDLKPSADPKDFFAPTDWKALDDRDADLGGSNPLPIDVADSSGITRVVLALGKDGKAYLLDRANLGGLGGALAVETVARGAMRTAPATYPVYDGSLVAFEGPGAACPNGASSAGLTVLKIEAHPAPKIATAWCAAVNGRGSPAVTVSDDDSNAIVWIVGAEGDNRLHGFRGDTGEPVFAGGGAPEAMQGLHAFATVMATDGRIFVAGDGRIYAFTP